MGLYTHEKTKDQTGRAGLLPLCYTSGGAADVAG